MCRSKIGGWRSINRKILVCAEHLRVFWFMGRKTFANAQVEQWEEGESTRFEICQSDDSPSLNPLPGLSEDLSLVQEFVKREVLHPQVYRCQFARTRLIEKPEFMKNLQISFRVAVFTREIFIWSNNKNYVELKIEILAACKQLQRHWQENSRNQHRAKWEISACIKKNLREKFRQNECESVVGEHNEKPHAKWVSLWVRRRTKLERNVVIEAPTHLRAGGWLKPQDKNRISDYDTFPPHPSTNDFWGYVWWKLGQHNERTVGATYYRNITVAKAEFNGPCFH